MPAKPPEARIGEVIQQWSLTEPLLFGAWTSHEVRATTQVKTIRCGRGRIEYQPDFVDGLKQEELREVMKFEAVRIVLKHPYERKKQQTQLAWEASNLAIQECMRMNLPMPTAEEVFETNDHDRQFFEYYYGLLVERAETSENEEEPPSEEENESEEDELRAPEIDSGHPNENEGSESDEGESSPMETYSDVAEVGEENVESWDEDAFMAEKLDELVEDIQSSNDWGSFPGSARELILANLRPKLDYRRILHAFRASVVSTQRRLTRMKPSRRYGFDYLGSRREFSTRLLFAIDVSGSVSTEDVQKALSVVNRFFRYGIDRIDVLYFDTEIKNADAPIEMKRAARSLVIEGRGGTSFQPIVDFLDDHRDYDGLIVFTDGIAPPPEPPKANRRTRIVWLFNSEKNWSQMASRLELPGSFSAFLRED